MRKAYPVYMVTLIGIADTEEAAKQLADDEEKERGTDFRSYVSGGPVDYALVDALSGDEVMV